MSEVEQLEQAIKALEAQRSILGDAVVNVAVEPLKQKLEEAKKIQKANLISDERKLVTIMFADLSGFTALSEKMDPENVRKIMNACFDVLVPVVEKYGGVIDKFIGDEIMALFGAPVAKENDAERALRASLEMMQALEKFNQDHQTHLGMHFGINTGLVVAGGLGSEGRQQYSVMGDAVNLAARLEGASEAGEIFVGPTTYKLTAAFFEFEKLKPISLKGKSEPVQIYLLKGLKKEVGKTRGIEGLNSPLIGRDDAFKKLESFILRLEKGNGGVALVLGEAGLGKSRLVSEIKKKFIGRFRWYEGRGLSHTESISYSIVNSLLQDIFEIEKDGRPQEFAEKIAQYLEKVFPEDSGQLLAYLSRLMGLPIPSEFDGIFKDVLPSAIQARMHEAFEKLILHLAAKGPLVLVWEDLHWADASSLSLLKLISNSSKKLPLLILGISRNNENQEALKSHFLDSELRVEVIDLFPLDHTQSSDLVKNLLNIKDLPTQTLELILTKSEGNPFFLEELLRSLIDSGMIIFDGDSAKVAGNIEALHVPDTLQGIVASRIDRLPLESKLTLQNASIIGRIFQLPILKILIGHDAAGLAIEGPLGELQKRALVRYKEEVEYIFKHAIIHEVTYNSLLISRRKKLHLLTGLSMEQVFSDQLEDLSPALAYHFAQGDDAKKATIYYLKSAKRAEDNFANKEALGFYLEAVGQIEQESGIDQAAKLTEIFEKIGSIYSLMGQLEEALGAFGKALERISGSDHIMRARIIRKQGLAFNASRRIPEMLENYLQAEKQLGEFSEEKDKAWMEEWLNLQLDRAWAYYFCNMKPELDKLIEKTAIIMDKHGSLVQRNRFYGTLFLSDLRKYRYFQLPDSMVERLQLQLETAKEIGNKALIGKALVYMGFARMWRNEHVLAEKIFLESFPDIEHVGDMDSLIIGKTYIALAMRKKGDLQKTLDYAQEGLDLAKRIKSFYYIANTCGILGWAEWKMGHKEKAIEYLKAGQEALDKVPFKNPVEFIIKGPLLGMAIEEENWDEAISYVKVFKEPSQQILPDLAYQKIDEANGFWESKDSIRTKKVFSELVEILKKEETGYV